MTEQQRLIIFEAGSGQVEVRLQGGRVRLTQEHMTALFGRDRSVLIHYPAHPQCVFGGRAGARFSVCKICMHCRGGKIDQVEHYNLDALSSVGYRVKSVQGTRFRQWATRILREHLMQGYTTPEKQKANPGGLA